MQKRVQVSSFVSPQAPVLIDDSRPAVTGSSVRAEWAQNFGGGVGASVLVIAMWLTLHGVLYKLAVVDDAWPDAAQVAIGAAIVGAIVFGALMVARSSLDEIVEGLDWQHAMSDLEAKDLRIIELETMLAAAVKRADVAELQANVQASNQAQRKYVAPAPERSQVWRDCEWMIQRRFDTGTWARDSIVEGVRNGKPTGIPGWTEKRWDVTINHLTRAGLVGRNGRKYEPIYDTAALMLEGLHEYEDANGAPFRRVGSVPDGPTHEVAPEAPEDFSRGGGWQ